MLQYSASDLGISCLLSGENEYRYWKFIMSYKRSKDLWTPLDKLYAMNMVDESVFIPYLLPYLPKEKVSMIRNFDQWVSPSSKYNKTEKWHLHKIAD